MYIEPFMLLIFHNIHRKDEQTKIFTKSLDGMYAYFPKSCIENSSDGQPLTKVYPMADYIINHLTQTVNNFYK